MCARNKPDGVALPGLFVKVNAFKGVSQRASLQKKEGKSPHFIPSQLKYKWDGVWSFLL